MKGHWCRESAAHRRGSSKQSQVQNNSCASVATTVKPSKASLHAMHDESACEDGNRRSTEHGSNLNLSGNGLATRWPPLATNGQPWPAEADHGKVLAGHGHQQPSVASLGWPQEAAGHLWPPTANRGQPKPTTGSCWPAVATSSQPWPASAGLRRLLATYGHQQPTAASVSRPREAAGQPWP